MKDPFDTATIDFVSRPVERPLLEKDIQKACVRHARSFGVWARKFSSPANRSVPDYIFSSPFWGKWAVEFKAPGKTSTKAQLEEQREMTEAGWDVSECDDIAQFESMLGERMSRNARSE